MAYVACGHIRRPSTDYTDADGNPRTVVIIDRVVIDVDSAKRLVAHKRARDAEGRDILADEAREIATPILDALSATGRRRREQRRSGGE